MTPFPPAVTLVLAPSVVATPHARARRALSWAVGAAMCALASATGARPVLAQPPDAFPSTSILKTLDLEDLMNIEVTSVSRHAEPLARTASAIQVVTGEEIRRSGATSIPEALRLVSNLQVARVNSSQWAISARGFDNVLANKLLVLIDGRSVYTPLYAGVFWDVQNVQLEDVDRIEVISGPGGALWGANAVNGVINIVTRDAAQTQGLFATGGGGEELLRFGGLRYGGKLKPSLSYRVNGEAFTRGGTLLFNGTDAHDQWSMAHGGFRADWAANARDHVTVQSDVYNGNPNPDGATAVAARGANVVGRWTRAISDNASAQLQFYFDQTHRDFHNGFVEDLSTYDVEWQHRFAAGRTHEITWGLGARLLDHETQNLPLFAFLPGHRRLPLYSALIQDEITLKPDRLRLTVGTKLEHHAYTGFEVLPSVRLGWTPDDHQTVWGAVSRAIRAPARIDRDFTLLINPTTPFIGRGNFQSEEMLAYELGWRTQSTTRFMLALSTFYNEYDNLRTVEPAAGGGLPITFGNGVKGHSYGAELATTYGVNDSWRLRAGYTFFRKGLRVKPGSSDMNNGNAESDDPRHQASIGSSADLPGRMELDLTARYVGVLRVKNVPPYGALMARLGWHATPHLDLALGAGDLPDDIHREFVPDNPSPRMIQRTIYGKVDIRW